MRSTPEREFLRLKRTRQLRPAGTYRSSVTYEDCFLPAPSAGHLDHLEAPALHRGADIEERQQVAVGGGETLQVTADTEHHQL